MDCPFCLGWTVREHTGPEGITYMLCDGCGAVTSFRARSGLGETRRLYTMRKKEAAEGYREALAKVTN